MAEELKKLEIIKNLQQSEAKNHLTRNSFFLVIEGFFILALSQYDMKSFQFTIGFFGALISISWLLIQDRSSRYIKHWKEQAQKLEESAKDIPDIYPKNIGGIEMRKVAYSLPIIFILFWAIVIIMVVMPGLIC